MSVCIKEFFEKIGNVIIDSMDFMEQVLAFYEEKTREEKKRNN
jgi:hypothetical protein